MNDQNPLLTQGISAHQSLSFPNLDLGFMRVERGVNVKVSDDMVMESECEREKERGRGQILQVRKERVNGYERERELGLERVCFLKRSGAIRGVTLEHAPLKLKCLFLN